MDEITLFQNEFDLKILGFHHRRTFKTRTKETHETRYHFHKPETEQQANEWLMRYLLSYNDQAHRPEKHPHLADWLTHLPVDGLRDMCTWEQFCRFAREPESRKVGVDARITVAGTVYEVEPDMAIASKT